MAKEPKTRKELEAIVMHEARASGKCGDLQSIIVLGPVDLGHSNWDIGTTSTHPTNLVSSACRLELNMIVGRLQAQYDLSDD
jgi:hypothetical protein